MKSGTVINTREPVKNSAMFHPIRNLQPVSCLPAVFPGEGSPLCYRYTTTLYADYETRPDASVNITSTIVGRNQWKILKTSSNEYTTDVSLQMTGSRHGWETIPGTLTNGVGNYDTPLPST